MLAHFAGVDAEVAPTKVRIRNRSGETMRTFTLKKLAGCVGVLLTFFAASALPSYAQVKPGDLITSANADRIKDLVSPGVFYVAKKGMSMKIVEPTRVDWPPPYKE